MYNFIYTKEGLLPYVKKKLFFMYMYIYTYMLYIHNMCVCVDICTH